MDAASRTVSGYLVNPVGFRNPVRLMTCVDFPSLVNLESWAGAL